MDGTPTIDPLAAPEPELLALSSDLLACAMPDGTLTYVNPAWTAALGWPAERLLATPLTDLAHADDREQLAAALDGRHTGCTCRLQHADGGARRIRWTFRRAGDTLQLAGQDVTDRDRLVAELQDFAYVASHDLAEPLRMVTAYLDLLSRRYAGSLDETADEFIGYAVGGAERMKAMIDALLAFSRVGTHELQPAEFQLRDVIGPSLGEDVELAEPLAPVVGDPTQVAQLLHHLVDNARKFRAPERPPLVTVSAAADRDDVRIDVADNGIGIPETQHERIFRPFARLHGRDEYDGIGMGLSLCRRIAERHGGRIAVASTPGTGSVFSVWLPR